MLDLLLITLGISYTALILSPSLKGEFVFDAKLIADKTRGITKQQSLWSMRWQSRPLLWWTYERDAVKHGANTLGWHLTNLAIHGVNAALVYAILRYWFEPVGSLVGMLLFSIHPGACACACSISGRSSSLCALFVLGAIVAFLCGWYWLVPVLGIMGFMSKEEAIVLPLMLGAVWWVK